MSLIFAACALLSSAGPAQGAVPQDSIASVAIRTLTRDAVRDPTAVLRFWQALERSGTPLVEANPEDSTVRLVTFVWKEMEPLDNVAVITPHSLIDVELGRMRHVPGTDVWFRSYLMRSDARMVYRFGPNDNMVPFTRDRNLIERMNGWQLDPLNSQVWTFGDGTRVSVLLLAGPSAHMMVDPEEGRGTVHFDTIPGSAAWPDQQVAVYLPRDYERGPANRPLAILMDGDAYGGPMGIDSVLDRLQGVAPGRLPVVVLIPPDPKSRTAQYDCNPSWSDFLAMTVVPWIDDHYQTGQNPQDRIVGGFSFGALAATCAAVRHPETFGNVLAQSGSFYRSGGAEEPEAVARHLAGISRLPIRWSLSIGLLETSPTPSRDPSMLTATRHLRDVLAAKGYEVQYREFFGGHEHVAWADLLPDAFVYLLQR